MWRIIKSKLIEKGISYIVKIEGANGGQEGSFLEFMFADDVAIITETASGMQEAACVMRHGRSKHYFWDGNCLWENRSPLSAKERGGTVTCSCHR